jgi:hypothetical protein
VALDAVGQRVQQPRAQAAAHLRTRAAGGLVDLDHVVAVDLCGGDVQADGARRRPAPAVIGPLAVVALQRLSSQTNSTGNA